MSNTTVLIVLKTKCVVILIEITATKIFLQILKIIILIIGWHLDAYLTIQHIYYRKPS